MLGVDDEPDRDTARQWNAPRPAVLQAVRMDVPVDFHFDALEMRMECAVASLSLDRGKIQQACDVARTTSGVDDPVRLLASEGVSCRRDRVGREPYVPAPVHPLRTCQVVDDPYASPRGCLQQRGVEAVSRDVVGVRRARPPHLVEAQVQTLLVVEDERRAALPHAVACDLVLDAQTSEVRHDGGNERLARDDRGPLRRRVDHDPHTGLRQQCPQHGSGRTTSEYRDGARP